LAQPTIQCSFNSGEWAPNLWARTDIEKYHSGAALLRNFFVDYRGGASTRVGTRYILRGFKDSTAIRLIPFQASFAVKYAMEFGDQYIRFFANGAPVLETGLNITGVTQANPAVVSVTNSYAVGDWVYITLVNGMTQLNGNYYIVHARTAGSITLYDLFGNPVDSSAFGAWTSGGTTARVFTLASPYIATDLALLKFVQNVNTMIFTHPSYPPYHLTYAGPTSWTLAAIVFGSTTVAPTGVSVSTTLTAGSVHYAYVVTSVNSSGQESVISTQVTLANIQDLRTTAGTNTISWSPVTGAGTYNVYKAIVSYAGPVAPTPSYGYIGSTSATYFSDSNITADFSQPPPTPANPFNVGAGVSAVTITTPGSYTTAPTATFAAPPVGGVVALGTPLLQAITATVSAGGSGYAVNDIITLSNGVQLKVLTLSTSAVATVSIIDGGSAAVLPGNPVAQVSTSGSGVSATFTLAWGVYTIRITETGTQYVTAPAVTFSAGSAAATSTLGPTADGNPAVPAFFQQRLALGATTLAPQTVYFSQPGAYYNYDISIPSQDDNAITASIVSGQLNNIKAMISQPGGLIVLTDGGSFLLNGGSLGSAITPASITASAQSFLGCNDMPPIVVNYDVLYVQSKGSSVRDASYNFYANVFTGADISVWASHLFFGYKLLEWAWAEEPYKIVWAVRNDGTLLSLTFIKEQDFIGWAHHDTAGGTFKSVCTIVEAASVGFQNFVYHVVQRVVNGQSVQYIEQFPERATTGLVKDYWTVDCGLQYSGSPATTFTGAQQLSGLTCTGLADGVIIPPFVMPYNGTFTLGTAASKVTVGLAFLPEAQSLYIDLGQPTVQSKDKKISRVTLRVTETLGLSVGSDSTNAVPMKDLVRGNVGQNTNKVVTDLVTGDATTTIDPKWQEAGQIYFSQPYPYPASVLGVIQDVTVGDTAK
jgi:hypothetical protein